MYKPELIFQTVQNVKKYLHFNTKFHMLINCM